jgi:phosphoglycolate phosphatase-like HAD superfamily hydrolase
VCGDDSEYRKPDPRVLDKLLIDGYDLEDPLVIGDQSVDAEFAYSLKARAILVARNGQIPHLDDKQTSVNIVESLAGV